jgi:hypothetical protein
MRHDAEWILMAADKARCSSGVLTLNVNDHTGKQRVPANRVIMLTFNMTGQTLTFLKFVLSCSNIEKHRQQTTA